MSSEAGAIPESVKEAVRKQHPGRAVWEVNDTIQKAEDRIAQSNQAREGSRGPEAKPDALSALEQADSALDGVMTAMCERNQTALRGLEALIQEITAQGDLNEELDILQSLKDALHNDEIASRREATESMDQQELVDHFRQCLTMRFRNMMRGDDPPSNFSDLEGKLRAIANAIVETWAMPQAQYAQIRPMVSPAFSIAQVNQGRDKRTPEVLKAYRDTAQEFVIGIFKRWIDGRSVPVERRLNDNRFASRPKASEGLQIAPEFQQSPKKELLLAAVAGMVTAVTEQMPVSPDDFDKRWRSNTGNGDPVSNASMEAISGFFFDGFSQGLSASGDSENSSQFAKQPEDISALYRGMVLRSLVDGSGEPYLYLNALSHMTPTDVSAIARAALGVLRKMPETDTAHDKIATLICMLPRGTVDDASLSEARGLVGDTKLQTEIRNLAEATGTQAADRVANAIATKYLYQTAPSTEAHRMHDDRMESLRDHAFMLIVRRAALADIARVVVKDSFAGASTAGSPLEMISQTKEVGLLEPPFEHTNPSTPPKLADSVSFKLKFLCVLLDPRIMNSSERSANIADKVAKYFEGASQYGVTKAELVQIHNRVAVAVATLNNHLESKRGSEWGSQRGIIFVDTLGVIGADKTEAYYSASTRLMAQGVSRVTDPRSFERTNSTAAVYLTDKNSRPIQGYVESFKPSNELIADVDVLDGVRGQMIERKGEDEFLSMVERRALGTDLVYNADSRLRSIRPDAPVASGYEALVAEARPVESAVQNIVREMPDLPHTIYGTPEEDELATYFESSKFPTSGIGAGLKRTLARNAARAFVQRTWGVDIETFNDKDQYDLRRSLSTAKTLINESLQAKKKDAWGGYTAKFDEYSRQLDRSLATVTATPESFAQKAIQKHELIDSATHTVSGFWFEDPSVQGKVAREEVRIESMGREEDRAYLNSLAKISREATEAYAAFLQPIINAFEQALKAAQKAGGYTGETNFRTQVIQPAWMKLRPNEYRFIVPNNLLETFAHALQPYLEARAQAIESKRANEPKPQDKLAKTTSPVTRAIGTMLK